jgi:hypothetical protein
MLSHNIGAHGKLCSNSEAVLMKLFYGIGVSSAPSGFDEASCVCSTLVATAEVRSSVLANVRAKLLHAEDAILINVTARKVVAPRGSILYNVVDDSEEGIVMLPGEVRVGVFSADGSQLIMTSATDIDGGKKWESRVLTNSMSFEEVYNANAEADPILLEGVMSRLHDTVWSKIGGGAAACDRNASSKRINSQVEYK